MCIMEVHAQATTDAMVQAIAHNLSTTDRDLDMMLKVAHCRNDLILLNTLDHVQNLVHRAYAAMLAEFGIQVALVTEDAEGHIHPHIGNERSFSGEMRRATEEAHLEETR